MGQETYIKGNGTHHSVPPPMQSKVELYRSTIKLSSLSKMQNSHKSMDRRYSNQKIDMDIKHINEEKYSLSRYKVKKLAGRNRVNMTMI